MHQSEEFVCVNLRLKALSKRHAGVQLGTGERRGVLMLGCVASVSLWFRSKERPRNRPGNRIFGFGRARNGTRAKKFPIPSTPPALSLAPFLTRSLTLVPLSLLRACYAGYGDMRA